MEARKEVVEALRMVSTEVVRGGSDGTRLTADVFGGKNSREKKKASGGSA
jgi:hypothetical protein